ncbi:MAG: hypothetical protein JW950_14185 [Deltaproteobacteria bacterium]|nr:hypothetical protein [Deltaproteobacteria bacterium]
MALGRKAVFVDLGSGSIQVKEIPRPLRETFLGGRGIGMRLLYSLLEPRLDPDGPGDRLIFSAGLLAGTPAPLAAGAIDVGGKSPVTGLADNLLLGGFFGAELRFAGFDLLVLSGKSEEPVYLRVYNGNIEILDAAPLVQADPLETHAIIREILGEENVQVISARVLGRDASLRAEMRTDAGNGLKISDLGLLMTSKNLKAVAVRGTLPIEIEDPEGALRHLGALTLLSPSEQEVVPSKRDLLQAVYEDECLQALTDSLGIATSSAEFLSPRVPYWKVCSLLVEAVTGLRISSSELMRAGRRIVNLEQLFNIREGFTGIGTRRFMKGFLETPESTPLKESEWELYCELHGWDRQGKPTSETLIGLGLDEQPDRFFPE